MSGGPSDAETPEVTAIGRTGRNAVIQLVLRTGVLRAVGFLGTILLARVLLPADYGVFAIVVILVAILGPLGDLGLGAALIQKRERPTDTELATIFTAQQLVWLALVALVWLLAPLVALAGPSLPPDADWMLRVTAVALLITHQQAVPGAMMSRVLRFGPLALIEVVQQGVYLVVALLLAVNGAGAWSFIGGILAQAVAGTTLMFVAWGRLPGIGIDLPTLRRVTGFGVAYQATNMLHLLREALVPMFGGLAGGVSAVGYLQFGQRLGRLVAGVDDVVARVAFPAFSRLQDDRARLVRALNYAIESSTVLLGLLLFWPIAAAPELIPVLFSERWAPAVPVFQLTAVAALISVPAQFLRGIGFAAGRVRPLLLSSALAVAVAFVVFPVLVASLGLVGGGIGFVIYATLMLAGHAYATRGIAPVPWMAMTRIYLLGAAAGVASATALGMLTGLAGLFMSGVVFVAAYGALLFTFERGVVMWSWQWLRSGRALEEG